MSYLVPLINIFFSLYFVLLNNISTAQLNMIFSGLIIIDLLFLVKFSPNDEKWTRKEWRKLLFLILVAIIMALMSIVLMYNEVLIKFRPYYLEEIGSLTVWLLIIAKSLIYGIVFQKFLYDVLLAKYNEITRLAIIIFVMISYMEMAKVAYYDWLMCICALDSYRKYHNLYYVIILIFLYQSSFFITIQGLKEFVSI